MTRKGAKVAEDLSLEELEQCVADSVARNGPGPGELAAEPFFALWERFEAERRAATCASTSSSCRPSPSEFATAAVRIIKERLADQLVDRRTMNEEARPVEDTKDVDPVVMGVAGSPRLCVSRVLGLAGP